MNSVLKTSIFVALAGAAVIYHFDGKGVIDTKKAAQTAAIITGGSFFLAKTMKVI